jgi:type IV secretion system protein VirB9
MGTPPGAPRASEQFLRETVETAAREAREEAERAMLEPAALPIQSPPDTAPPLPQSTTEKLIKDLRDEVKSLQDEAIVSSAMRKATKSPKAAKQIASKTIYSYQDENVYDIRAMSDHITDIELQPGEVLTELPASGDSSRWKVGVARSGSKDGEVTHLIIRPIDEDIETNMLLTTNRRVYRLRLISSDWYMPAVSWTYPDDEAAVLRETLARKESIEPISTNTGALFFDYEIRGDDVRWKPVRVFDDGAKTFIQMSPQMKVSEAPPLFVLEDGEPALVNYRLKDGSYIVDRLFDEAELRIGKKRVSIRRNDGSQSFFERIFG